MTKIPSVRALLSVRSLGFCAALSFLAFFGKPLPAATVTGLCNTGTTIQGATCSGLLSVNPATPDPSYVLLAGNPLGSTTSYAIPANVAYIANDSVSEWIGPTPTDTGTCCGPGDYTYQLTFTVFGTGWVPIAGQWAADNEATMFLTGSNGTTNEGSTNGAPSSQEAWTPFSFGFDQVSNVPTNYELTFVVENTGTFNTPTALRVEFDNAAPEPSTFAALGAGMVIIGFIKRKQFGRPSSN